MKPFARFSMIFGVSVGTSVGLSVGSSSVAFGQSNGGSGKPIVVAPRVPAPVFRDQALTELVPKDPASRNLIEVEELVSKPDIPPPKRYTPVLKKLPPSFLIQSYGRFHGSYDITGLDVGKRPNMAAPAEVTLNSFILDANPEGVGRVDEIEVGEKVASIGQAIYVHMKNDAQVGQRFLAVQPRGKIKDTDRKEEVGSVVDVGGVIEITSAIGEHKGNYRAVVVSSVSPIMLGSLLMEEDMPKATFASDGSLRNVETRVIGGEFDSKRRLFGEHATVYLNGGSEAGLSVGDMLPVRARRQNRRADTPFPDSNQSIGLLKVVKVERKVATAIVIRAHDEIVPGDLTGGELPEKSRAIDYSGESSQRSQKAPLEKDLENELDLD